MPLEIRTIAREEGEAWLAALRRGFLDPPRPGDAEAWGDDLDISRARAALDGGRIVGTLRSFPTELTLPGGGLLPVSALTSATVTATHRRRGLLTRMVAEDLRDSAERGEAASILIASEYPIYGRFGYGHATDLTDWEVSAGLARFRHRGEGEVHLAEPARAREVAPAIWERVRRGRPGAIAREPLFWDVMTGVREWPGRSQPERAWAVCESGGEPIGVLAYKIEKKWAAHRPEGVLQVELLAGISPAAEARLWRYACEVDWIATVKADTRPADEMLPWFLENARAARQTMRSDMTWVRPLDVARLLGGRALAAEGRACFEVSDEAGFAGGRYELEGGPEGAICRRTEAAAEVALSAAALGTLSLGGVRAETLAAAGLVDEFAPGAVARLGALLGWPVAPWTGLWF